MTSEKCCGCQACVCACPQKCITMISDDNGFLYPRIDSEQCNHCGLCKKVCPVLHKRKKNTSPETYAVQNINEQIRLQSSSGGMFTMLAEYILDKGGVVFGAAFDQCFNVEHIAVERKEDLYKLRGSKYVQSQINAAYELAKHYLETGRFVYFSGTPCQIQGLYGYLRKEYENLFTQDIICHGVASPGIWRKYLLYQEERTGAKIKKINFRDKTNGWNTYSLRFVFENGEEYLQLARENSYMNGFLKNYTLRDSCYHCKFKDKFRISDFTLADFWGLKKVVPEMSDGNGTSLVFVNSDKGREIFKVLQNDMRFHRVDENVVLQYNPSMIQSSLKPCDRKKILNVLQTHSWDAVDKYFTRSLMLHERIRRKIQRIDLILKIRGKS